PRATRSRPRPTARPGAGRARLPATLRGRLPLSWRASPALRRRVRLGRRLLPGPPLPPDPGADAAEELVGQHPGRRRQEALPDGGQRTLHLDVAVVADQRGVLRPGCVLEPDDARPAEAGTRPAALHAQPAARPLLPVAEAQAPGVGAPDRGQPDGHRRLPRVRADGLEAPAAGEAVP